MFKNPFKKEFVTTGTLKKSSSGNRFFISLDDKSKGGRRVKCTTGYVLEEFNSIAKMLEGETVQCRVRYNNHCNIGDIIGIHLMPVENEPGMFFNPQDKKPYVTLLVP